MAQPKRDIEPGTETAERPLGPEVRHSELKDLPDDVLVFNSRGGVYQGYVSQAAPEHSTDRQQRIDVRTLRLYPGLNYCNRSLFLTLAAQPGLAERLARSEIVEVTDFRRLSPKMVADYIKHSANLPALRRLIAKEQEERSPREDVVAALQKQITAAQTDAAVETGRRASA